MDRSAASALSPSPLCRVCMSVFSEAGNEKNSFSSAYSPIERGKQLFLLIFSERERECVCRVIFSSSNDNGNDSSSKLILFVWESVAFLSLQTY